MIVVDPPGANGIRVVGVVRGLVADVAPAREAVAAYRPTHVGLGISPSELEALAEHFVGTAAEPLVPLGPTEVAEMKALARYGEVGAPQPAFIELLGWGRSNGVPVVGLDPDEDVQAELFVAHIGYLELVRRTVRERRAGRAPPAAPDADAFALAWDRSTRPGRGSERYARAREVAFLEEMAKLGDRRRRLAVVVDRERVGRLVAMLGSGGPAAPG